MALKISDLPTINAVLKKDGCTEFVVIDASFLAHFISKLELAGEIDEDDYLARYPDIAQAVKSGAIESGLAHYLPTGYSEGRVAKARDIEAG